MISKISKIICYSDHAVVFILYSVFVLFRYLDKETVCYGYIITINADIFSS